MVGPLKKAPVSSTRLLIAVDKCTKWIEAKSIVKPSSQEAVKFFLTSSTSLVYTGKKFLDFADGYGIKINGASVGHLRTNG
jgi:hypothetical protein